MQDIMSKMDIKFWYSKFTNYLVWKIMTIVKNNKLICKLCREICRIPYDEALCVQNANIG